MIWISLLGLRYPENWVVERDKALKDLIDADDGDRKDLLRSGHIVKLWRDMAEHLAALSHDKCWYCETPLARDDLMVDHFRPKGKVFEDDDHPGYWWLAIDEKNFRLSCRYCNERRVDKVRRSDGGKATHFPLVRETSRAKTRHDDWECEEPELLDPVEVVDPPLLTFLSDGRPIPSWDVQEDPEAFRRAQVSIGAYHLAHPRLVGPRVQVAQQVAEAITRVDMQFRRYLKHKDDPMRKTLYNQELKRLAMFCHGRSPYAGVARAVVKQHRTPERAYLDEVLSILAN